MLLFEVGVEVIDLPFDFSAIRALWVFTNKGFVAVNRLFRLAKVFVALANVE